MLLYTIIHTYLLQVHIIYLQKSSEYVTERTAAVAVAP